MLILCRNKREISPPTPNPKYPPFDKCNKYHIIISTRWLSGRLAEAVGRARNFAHTITAGGRRVATQRVDNGLEVVALISPREFLQSHPSAKMEMHTDQMSECRVPVYITVGNG